MLIKKKKKSPGLVLTETLFQFLRAPLDNVSELQYVGATVAKAENVKIILDIYIKDIKTRFPKQICFHTRSDSDMNNNCNLKLMRVHKKIWKAQYNRLGFFFCLFVFWL